MSIKAILFDMDGVLIDARDWHYQALNEALQHFGYTISLESHLSTFDGLPTRIKLEMLSESQGLPREIHNIVNELKQKYTIIHSYAKCKPTFNHRLCLSKLSSNYKIAVCSNSIKNTIVTMLTISGLIDYVDLIVSNEDVRMSKPDPEMYQLAMNKFDLDPSQCLIVEDSEHGIQAAKASNAHLLEVGLPADVTYERLIQKINTLS